MQQIAGEGHGPVVFERKAHLRHGARIDAQCLAAAAQPTVLQIHVALLAAHRQCAAEPSALHIGLLYDEVARVVHGYGDVGAESPVSPRGLVVRVVWGDAARDGSPGVAVALLQRTESVFVGVKPERRLAVGAGALCLEHVFHAACRFPALHFVGVLLGTDAERNEHQDAAECRFYHILVVLWSCFVDDTCCLLLSTCRLLSFSQYIMGRNI